MSESLAFIDANVVVYATGVSHPYRDPCQAILEFGSRYPRAFVTSAEMMQEILHIGLRRNDPGRIGLALRSITTAIGRIEPLMAADVMNALGTDGARLDARDRIHLAVMRRVGCERIVSADRAFEGVPGVTRLDPLGFEGWRETLAAD